MLKPKKLLWQEAETPDVWLGVIPTTFGKAFAKLVVEHIPWMGLVQTHIYENDSDRFLLFPEAVLVDDFPSIERAKEAVLAKAKERVERVYNTAWRKRRNRWVFGLTIASTFGVELVRAILAGA